MSEKDDEINQEATAQWHELISNITSSIERDETSLAEKSTRLRNKEKERKERERD